MAPTILTPEVLAGREAFGHRLRELREAAGLTQERLGEASGVDRKTITRVEGAQRSPTVDQVLMIAAALHRHPRELFDWPEDDDQV